MDRLAARIHGGDAGRGKNDGVLAGFHEEAPQHRRLAGAGPAGEEEITLRARAFRDPFGGRGIDSIGQGLGV